MNAKLVFLLSCATFITQYPNWSIFIYLNRWHWMYYRQLFKNKYLFVKVVLFNNFYLLKSLEPTKVSQLCLVEA